VELCHIPPARQTSFLPEGLTHHLCIADVALRYPEYREFYANRARAGDFVIMDTAAFEGETISIGNLVNMMEEIQPMEIVLPDDIHDRRNTFIQSYDAARTLRQNGYTGFFMGVPHGDTLGEYLLSVKELEQISGVRTFGIQEEVQDLFGDTRANVVRAVLSRVGHQYDIHLLGVQDDLHDILDPYIRQRVRTADTGKFIVWGLNGIEVDPQKTPYPGYPGRVSVGGRMGYFDWYTNDVNAYIGLRDVVQKNINMWREYLRG